ncbi:MAG: hypothetical protein ACREV9_09880 [Burkholderiales bacterium]
MLVSREYAVPYHLGYYDEFSQRVKDSIRAHYTPALEELRDFIRRYSVKRNAWIHLYQPEADAAIKALERRERPAIGRLLESCQALETNNTIVLAADCISGWRS